MCATPCGVYGARLPFCPPSLGNASFAVIASSKYIFCVLTDALGDRELIRGDVTLVLDATLSDHCGSQSFECVDYSGRRLVRHGGSGIRGGQ